MNVIIALGGNIGPVLQYFMYARSALQSMEHCVVVKHSPVYSTPALGPQGQDDYLNAVLSIQTTDTPNILLSHLHDIENACLRTRTQHWGPRTLDLDMIDYAGFICSTPVLTLPHPEAMHRAFVLLPLADIIPDWQHPVSKRYIQDLLAGCDCQGIQRIANHW